MINRAERGKAVPDPDDDGASAQFPNITHVSSFHCFSSFVPCVICFCPVERMSRADANVSISRQQCQRGSSDFFCFTSSAGRTGQVWIFWEIFSILQKMTQLWPHIYVDVSMKKFVSLQKLAETKKDARLTIRIPKELKNRIDGIDKLYGVALPKIANECLKAFC